MYDKNYYLAHREEILARAKKWREEHPVEYKQALRRCVMRNKVKYNLKRKLTRCAQGLANVIRQREYYKNHREKELERVKKWRREHQEAVRRYAVERYILKKFRFIDGWNVLYENQNGQYHWRAVKWDMHITDEKAQGFTSLQAARNDAMKVLG